MGGAQRRDVLIRTFLYSKTGKIAHDEVSLRNVLEWIGKEWIEINGLEWIIMDWNLFEWI